MHQQTLRTPVEFSGIGLHTGEHAAVRILQAPADKGIVFRRVDLDNFELLADVASVARVAYATPLMSRGAWTSTAEHPLSVVHRAGRAQTHIDLDNRRVPLRASTGVPR